MPPFVALGEGEGDEGSSQKFYNNVGVMVVGYVHA